MGMMPVERPRRAIYRAVESKEINMQSNYNRWLYFDDEKERCRQW